MQAQRAAWLSRFYPSLPAADPGLCLSPSRRCPPLCAACTPRGVCTRCVATNGAGRSVYQDANKVCRVCLAANCKTCSANGKCAVCNAGFKVVNGVCQRKCSDPRCLSCPAAANKCTKCVAESGGYSIYLNLQGQCKAVSAGAGVSQRGGSWACRRG